MQGRLDFERAIAIGGFLVCWAFLATIVLK